MDVHHRLDGDVFRSTLHLENTGPTPMPAGMGFHPYFTRGDAVVHFRVAAIYPDAHDTRIPSGPAEPVDPRRDFSTPRPLDPGAFMDFCAPGWDGVARIHWPSWGVGVDIRSDLDHLVFFNPPKPWFALEPVSNGNDGFNRRTLGDPHHGVRVLAPGERFTATMSLTVADRRAG